MKIILALACAVALACPALAADHGPVFGYATPVNSQGEFSFDTGLIGRHGSQGTALTESSQIGYGITPHITLTAVLPATFGNAALPETRMAGGGEWSSSVAWRFQHSVTSVGRRIESTASLGLVVPGPQQESGVLAGLHRAPGVAATLASGLAAATHASPKPTRTAAPTRSPGARSTVIAHPVCAERQPLGLSRLCRTDRRAYRRAAKSGNPVAS